MSVTIAAVSMAVSFDKRENLDRYVHYIDKASAQGANLVVFPEQSLQGYFEHIRRLPHEAVEHHFTHAEMVPDGPSCTELASLARDREIHICFGMTERHPEYADVLYNSAVLLGPQGLVGIYRKVHQPGSEMHIYLPGNAFPVFDTALGRIGMNICYDKLFPEAARELALQGAEIILLPTAWPISRPDGDVATDFKGMQYDVTDITRAVENECWYVSANVFGMSGAQNYYGHSRIVRPDGTVATQVGYEEGMAVASCDIAAEIMKVRIANRGHSMFKDRHPHLYKALGSEKYEWHTRIES